MGEAMAIESIAEEYARFKGYFTETRVPFKLEIGHSDIDVLGFHPQKGTTLVIECKAWGSPDQYFNFCGDTLGFRKEFRKIITHWKYFKKSPNNKIWNFNRLDEIWYVIPGYCDDKEEIEGKLSKELNHIIKIIPIHELIRDVMFEVKEDKDKRRKRYSNPALEFCRWLLRCHEKGRLSLVDIDLKLKGEKQTYETLKMNYFMECLRNIKKNVEGRGKFINTRVNSLKLLSKMRKKATIPELGEEAHRRKMNMDYNRIDVGLSTWINLGVVNGNKKEGFFINDSFKSIVKNELKLWQ